MKTTDQNIYSFVPELCIEDYSILVDENDRNPKKGIFWRILSLFNQLLHEINKSLLIRRAAFPTNSIVFFGQHYNEYVPYLNLFNGLGDSRSDRFFIIGNRRYRNDFPYIKIYLHAITYIPKAIRMYYKEEELFKKKSFSYAFDQICLVLACQNVVPKYLKEVKPSKIVISNHNSVFHLVLASVAQEAGIETAYIQHAIFSRGKFNFPQTLNQIFLDGEYSKNRLPTELNKTRNIYLFGSLFQGDTNKTVSRVDQDQVAICTNLADDIRSVITLISSLKTLLPKYNVIIRPHPSDKRGYIWNQISEEFDVKLSQSSESIYTLLGSVSFIIAGESNVHLVAINAGVPSYYYNFNSVQFFDWYGFIKNGLVIDISDLDKFVRSGLYKSNHVDVSKLLMYNIGYGPNRFPIVCNSIATVLLEGNLS